MLAQLKPRLFNNTNAMKILFGGIDKHGCVCKPAKNSLICRFSATSSCILRWVTANALIYNTFLCLHIILLTMTPLIFIPCIRHKNIVIITMAPVFEYFTYRTRKNCHNHDDLLDCTWFFINQSICVLRLATIFWTLDCNVGVWSYIYISMDCLYW